MVRELLVLLVWTVVLFVLMLAPVPGITREVAGFGHWDKLAHFGLFAITGLVSAYSSKMLGTLHTRILFGLLFSGALALVTEGAQHFVANRSGTFVDFLADLAGLSLALLLFALWKLR
jgi:VanZ family protein